jgi:hypothetical protein
MALARSYAMALAGVEGHLVEIEADIENGLVALLLVGLPGTALREARDRIRSAIINSGQARPQRRITVGLSPASLPKRGSGFDLATQVPSLPRGTSASRTESTSERSVTLRGPFLQRLSRMLTCRKYCVSLADSYARLDILMHGIVINAVSVLYADSSLDTRITPTRCSKSGMMWLTATVTDLPVLVFSDGCRPIPSRLRGRGTVPGRGRLAFRFRR